MSFDKVIFDHLLYNEEYARKTLPFLKSEYFHDNNDKIVFELINDYVKKYNSIPSKEALYIDLSNKNGISENSFKTCKEIIDNIKKEYDTDQQWLLDQTENFCQEKSVYNAIMDSINILEDKTGKKSKGAIPSILSDALSVSFDNNIGHDFIEDFEKRFDFYNKKDIRIQFDLSFFNQITRGGLPRKTLNVALAGCVHPETKVKIRFRKRV